MGVSACWSGRCHTSVTAGTSCDAPAVAGEAAQLLRVGRAAVLVDVEPFQLAFFGNTQSAGSFDGVQQGEASRQSGRGHRRAADRLCDQLKRCSRNSSAAAAASETERRAGVTHRAACRISLQAERLRISIRQAASSSRVTAADVPRNSSSNWSCVRQWREGSTVRNTPPAPSAIGNSS